MAAKFLIPFACLLALTHGVQLNSDGKIKLTVITTSGCSDVQRFVNNQLVEAYSLYGEFLDLEIVPWGKSTWDGVGAITCQFGAVDCWANRLHRCVLNMLKEDQKSQVEYMQCEFTTLASYVDGSYACAQKFNLDLVAVDFCVANNHDDLDRAAQAISDPPIREFDFVPALVFNDVLNREEHLAAQTRLASVICFALAADSSTGINHCQI